VRYNRAENLIHLALEMQAARSGLTIVDIMEKFSVSRRTAIRMRDAVLRAFPQADEVPSQERTKRWNLPHGSAKNLVGITADDLATLQSAITAFEHSNLLLHAQNLRQISAKIRGLLPDQHMRQIDPDLEALMEAEGMALRPGPRARINAALFETLREAIKSCRKISFDYISRRDNQMTQRTVCPLGLIYGHRHYLVAFADDEQPAESSAIRYFSLPGMRNFRIETQSFLRPADFDLHAKRNHCFGIFDEPAVDVVWKFSAHAAPVARQFLFHPTQNMEELEDGSLLVRFQAGGLLEMAWHLMSWGQDVEVLAPASLHSMLPTIRPIWPALP